MQKLNGTIQKENILMHKGLQVRMVHKVLSIKTVLFASAYHIVASEMLFW